MTIKHTNLMKIADSARWDAKKHDDEDIAFYRASVEYLYTMDCVALPSGGFIGGVNAFKRTGELLRDAKAYDAYRQANNVDGYTICEKLHLKGENKGLPHGRQPLQLAHIFARSYGGVFDGKTLTNIIPTCQACNHEQSDDLHEVDIEFLKNYKVTLDV